MYSFLITNYYPFRIIFCKKALKHKNQIILSKPQLNNNNTNTYISKFYCTKQNIIWPVNWADQALLLSLFWRQRPSCWVHGIDRHSDRSK